MASVYEVAAIISAEGDIPASAPATKTKLSLWGQIAPRPYMSTVLYFPADNISSTTCNLEERRSDVISDHIVAPLDRLRRQAGRLC